MIARAIEKNLCFVFEPPESARVNDPCAISLIFGTIRVALLGKFSAARFARFLRETRESLLLRCFHLFARFPAVARDRSALHETIICRFLAQASPDFA